MIEKPIDIFLFTNQTEPCLGLTKKVYENIIGRTPKCSINYQQEIAHHETQTKFYLRENTNHSK